MSDTLAGKLLVAMPGMGDPRFHRSVIMMCSHDAQHALGIVINKPKDDISLTDVLGHLGIDVAAISEERAVLDGGPVRQDRGYVLHTADYAGAGQDVAPGIKLTATRDILEAVAGEHAPERFILALGCSGWGAGQLENELKQNAWLVAPADDDIVFDAGHEDKWARAIRKLGFEPSQLSGDMGQA